MCARAQLRMVMQREWMWLSRPVATRSVRWDWGPHALPRHWDSLWAESVRFDLARWPGSNAASEGSPRRRRRHAASDPRVPPSAAATRSWFCLFKAALGALRANCRGATNNHVLRRTISEGQGRHFCARAHACWVSSLVSLLVCEGVCVGVRGSLCCCARASHVGCLCWESLLVFML